jgi:hypothetical protein
MAAQVSWQLPLHVPLMALQQTLPQMVAVPFCVYWQLPPTDGQVPAAV